MLYPHFDDLVALRGKKGRFKHPQGRKVDTAVSGGHRSPFRGRGLDFDSVREYVLGDDIRNIDWRVTARTGAPHLKLFQEERERHFLICLDMNETMRFGTRRTFKSVQAARVAALLGWKGIDQHDRVSTALFGDVPGGVRFCEASRTKHAFSSFLKLLTQPTNETHHIPIEVILREVYQHVRTGTLVYLISDFMDFESGNDYELSLGRLKKRCDLIFISVNDRSDHTLVPLGPLALNATAKEKMVIDTDYREGREAYHAKWIRNRSHLNEVTKKYKIPLIEVTTEMNIGLIGDPLKLPRKV